MSKHGLLELTLLDTTYHLGQSVIVDGRQDGRVFESIPGTIVQIRNPGRQFYVLGIEFDATLSKELKLHNLGRILPARNGFYFSRIGIMSRHVTVIPEDNFEDFEELFV